MPRPTDPRANNRHASMRMLILMGVPLIVTPAVAEGAPDKIDAPGMQMHRQTQMVREKFDWSAPLDTWREWAFEMRSAPNLATSSGSGEDQALQRKSEMQADTGAPSGGKSKEHKKANKDKSERKSKTDEVASVNAVGGVGTFKTSNPGRIHIQAATGVSTADFFRGTYDNVPGDLDELTFPIELSSTIEVISAKDAFLRDLSFTFGTANNVSSDDDHPLIAEDGHWYESDNFVGLAARLGKDWLTGLTYTAFTTPLGDFDPVHEVAFAAQYSGSNFVGDLKPQLKFAERIDESEGRFAQLSIAPSRTVFERNEWKLILATPVTLGVGFDDYYGRGTGTTGYLGVGVKGSIPLTPFMRSGFGDWTLSSGLDILIRADDLQDVQPEFADDTAIFIGALTLSLAY